MLIILGLVSLRSFYFRRCRGVSKMLSHSFLHMFPSHDFFLGVVDFWLGELEVFSLPPLPARKILSHWEI